MILSMIIFGDHADFSARNWAGLALSLLGFSLYSYFKFQVCWILSKANHYFSFFLFSQTKKNEFLANKGENSSTTTKSWTWRSSISSTVADSWIAIKNQIKYDCDTFARFFLFTCFLSYYKFALLQRASLNKTSLSSKQTQKTSNEEKAFSYWSGGGRLSTAYKETSLPTKTLELESNIRLFF